MERTVIELPPSRRNIQVRASSFEEATNSIEVIWTTGAKVRRYSWRDDGYYDEELVVDQSSIRLERLNGGAPFLDTHDDWTLSSVIGSVISGSAEIRGGKGYARVQLSVADEHAGLVANIKAGVIRNISVGYRIHQVEKTESDEGQIPIWRVTDWEPLEISAVPVPADAGSVIRSEAKANGERLAPCQFIVNRSAPKGAQTEAKMPNENEIDTNEAVNVTPARGQNAAAINAERRRSATIRALATSVNVPSLGEEHANKDTSVEAFRSLLLDHLASTQSPEIISNTGNGIEVGMSDHEKRATAIANALMHRILPSTVELTNEGRNFRNMSLLEIGRDMLEARGVRTGNMSRAQLAGKALETRSAGYMTTTDFPGILSNVANTTLRAAYQTAPQTFRPLVRETTVPDFRPVSRAQLGEAPSLEKVNEHGEFKRGSIGEGSETYKIATYGKVVGITRQVIINDDLDAFTRILRGFGIQAAQLESDLVWAQILANPTMGDTKTLFHAAHGNLAGAGSAIGVDSVSAGRIAFSKQTGLDGKTMLGLAPRYIVVPIALQTKAEQFKGQIYAAKNDDVVPDSMKQISIIAESRLDNGISRPDDDIVAAGSATAWYLAGDPAFTDIVELAYLTGNRGVYTEERVGFDIDGVEIKARLDVGAKIIDWRNIWKNPGA